MMPMLIERASARGLARAEAILLNRDKSAHERYLELVECVESERKHMADLFDDLRRSTARMALANVNMAPSGHVLPQQVMCSPVLWRPYPSTC